MRGRVIKFLADNARTRYLSNEEQIKLWKACKGFNPIIHDVILLAITTGMRTDEIRQLHWEHVKLNKRWLYVAEAKNGTKRHIPLGVEALDMLQQRFDAREDKENPWVFPSDKKDVPFDFKKLFRQVLDKSGIQDFRFHDLRHTAASYLAMGGASLLELQKILGHKTLNMVQRYAHLSKDHMESVPEKMSEYLAIPGMKGKKDGEA